MTAGVEDGGVAGVNGMLEPDAVADAVVRGLAAESFLILPHPEVLEYFRRKASDYDRWIVGMQRLQARFGGPDGRCLDGATRVPARMGSASRGGHCRVLNAIVLIKAQPQRVAALGPALAAINGVSEVYSVTGDEDLVALLHSNDTEQVASSSPSTSRRSTVSSTPGR